MNVSPIVPIAHLDEIRNRSFHLTLAHLYDDPLYFDFYQREAERGALITIDNGAHERGSGEGPEFLLDIASRIGAKEIVLADYLFEADQTVSLTSAAIKYLKSHPEQVHESEISSAMIVAQGSDLWSWKRCLYHQIEMFTQSDLRLDLVLGISKDYHELFGGGLLRLLERDVLPIAEDLDCDVHLLGWCKTLWDLGEIGRLYGNRIRSVDSARPFVYGLNEILLDPREEVPPYPKRPANFFECQLTREQIDISMSNVDVFDRLAQGMRLRQIARQTEDHWLTSKD